MRRTPLDRRTPLKRTGRLRTRVKSLHGENLDQKAIWKTSHGGYCQCGCSRWTMHLERHHVIAAEYVKREGRIDLLWDPRNAMDLHPACHERHTNASRRIAIEHVPEAALVFAVELFGEARAAVELRRFYWTGGERRVA